MESFENNSNMFKPTPEEADIIQEVVQKYKDKYHEDISFPEQQIGQIRILLDGPSDRSHIINAVYNKLPKPQNSESLPKEELTKEEEIALIENIAIKERQDNKKMIDEGYVEITGKKV